LKTTDFIDTLSKKGITLWKDNNNLRYRAPKGVMTEAILAQLRNKKYDILALVKEKEPDAGSSSFTLVPDLQNIHEPFPLTDIQQAYWMGRKSDFVLGNISTNNYIELEKENLDVQKLQIAWHRVVGRHDMLRAVVLPDGQQKILRQVPPYEFKIYHLQDKNADEVKRKLTEISEQMSHQVMNPETWPLFDIRISLYQDKARIHIGIDYLFADASSMLLIFHEWYLFYSENDAGLTPFDISFRDYIIGQAKLKKSPLYQRTKNEWFKRLPTFPLAPGLALKKNPREIITPKFLRRSSGLSPEEWNTLKKKASKANLTPSGILLAAFSQVLAVFTNSDRFTVNLTLFDRNMVHPQVINLVGEFTSVVLVEVDYSKNESFIQKANRLQKRLLDDLDHRMVSGVEVLRELNRIRGENENTMMPIVFTSTLGFGSVGHDVLVMNKLGTLIYNMSQTPQVWLDHQVVELQGALIYNWDTVEELFHDGFIDDMFNTYNQFLKSLANDKLTWHEQKFDLVPAHQKKYREIINQTDSPISQHILHTLFKDQVIKQPDKPAIISSKGTFSYKYLYQYASLIASTLQKQGTAPGKIVAIIMEKGEEQIAAALGILVSGAAYLPIEAELPAERIKFLIENSETHLILTQSWLETKLPSLTDVVIIPVDKIEYTDKEVPVTKIKQHLRDMAYIIYTSGSTGQPKGVMIDHRGAVNTILDINQRFNVQANDRILAISSLSFDLSVYDIFGMLAAGGTAVMPDHEKRTDPEHWAILIEKHQITIWDTAPALMEMYIEYARQKPGVNCDSLRLALLSGDWIPVDLPGKIRSRIKNIQVISLGGATEASIWSILYPIDDVPPHWKSIPYGKPMKNQHFYVLNESLHACPDWVPGDLYIGGIGLAMGYWRDKQKTTASFIIHPRTGERLYKTGDLGRFLPDGNIEFLGRNDSQVKIRGYRIELGEIEAALRQFESVSDAVVSVYTDENGAKKLVGYVVSYNRRPSLAEEIREFLIGKLPRYMVPSLVMFLDSLPLSPNGKVDRKALPIPGHDWDSSRKDFVSPSTALQKQLADIWAKILEKEKVGIYDHFFAIGGDSLMATRIVLNIREALKVNLSLPKFFDLMTIAELAAFIEDSRESPIEVNRDFLSTADLKPEAVLDPAVKADGLPAVDTDKPAKIFLTGATGFIGAFLLEELLNTTNADIYCLVRSPDVEAGKNRLRKSLQKYSLLGANSDDIEDRIIPVIGDLSKPFLGIPGNTFADLSQIIDVIYHNGARVHFAYSYHALKPVNVSGTREILRLACREMLKPVHYVSSISVFSDYGYQGNRVVKEDDDLDTGGTFDTGYAQSKWVAEKILAIARQRGIPVTVYRLGMVTGDTVNGFANLDDYVYRLIKGCLQVRCIPKTNAVVDFVPVDFVSKAIVYLSRQKNSLGNIFHLVHPRPVPLDKIINWLRSRGRTLEETTYKNWRKKLGGASINSQDNALYPLLSMFPEKMPQEEVTGNFTYDMKNTIKGLENSNLTFPDLDVNLFTTYFEYLKKVGYIDGCGGVF
jgi:pyochelin synthetase